MPEWVGELLGNLSGSPVLQGVVAALATFVLEDPTTIGCGLLVTEGRMAFLTAFVGVSLGISLGDLGLYGIGRTMGPRAVRLGRVSQPRIDRAAGWFHRNLVLAVVLSRFLPGMRLPTYLAAGLLRAPLWRFLAVAVGASVVWTLLLLHVTVVLGETVWPLLGRYRWPVALLAVILLVLLQRRAAARLDREPGGEQVVSSFELWPPWLFYPPVLLYALWLAVRFRGLTLPTAANPGIYAGGLIAESKSQILGLVPEQQRHWLASYVTLRRPAAGTPLEPVVSEAVGLLEGAGIGFPVVAKPDMGQRGAGVRPVHDPEELLGYLQQFPAGETLLLQELVGGEDRRPAVADIGLPEALRQSREAGVLYWRFPGEDQGTVFSITLKQFPAVIGDGKSTLVELIAGDPRARLLQDLYQARHREHLAVVPAAEERFPLVFAGNHCQGTVFKDGTDYLTPALAARIDEICRSIPGFCFGRLDLLFDDAGALLEGEGFKIVEINGAGAEATHIWDAGMSLGTAYRTLFRQFEVLYTIGAENRRRGHRPLPLLTVLKDVLRYRRLARGYPATR